MKGVPGPAQEWHPLSPSLLPQRGGLWALPGPPRLEDSKGSKCQRGEAKGHSRPGQLSLFSSSVSSRTSSRGVSGNDGVLYLLVSISFTLCLVPEFAEGERRAEKRLLCLRTAIQSRRGRLAAWHYSGMVRGAPHRRGSSGHPE